MKTSRGWNHYMEPYSLCNDFLDHIWHCSTCGQCIIILVFGEYNTQMHGLVLPYSLGSGRTDAELELVSPY